MARSPSVRDSAVIVGIDLGTSACKVVAFDGTGKRLACGRSAYRNVTDAGGRVEQNPAVWWRAVGDAIAASGVKGLSKRVVGYAVSTLRAAVIPADSRGRPLSAAILAPDARARAEAHFLAEYFGEKSLYNRTGLRSGTYASLARILWLRNHCPKVFSRTARILCAQDYLLERLCGTSVTDLSHASRTLCLNVRAKSWDPRILDAVDLRVELFPKLVAPGAVAGDLTRATSRAFDLPVAPVIAAGGDQMCASVGLGATREGRVTINHGTGSFVESAAAAPYLNPERKILLSVHVLPNYWIHECPILSTGRLVADVVNAVSASRADVYAIVGASLDAPAFKNHDQQDLLFLPYLSGSTAPHWDPTLPGVLWGLRSHHRIRDIVRALLCSILFDLRRCLNLFPTKPPEIVVGGGLARLKAFNQLQADIYGVPVVRTSEPEATALGAAVVAFTALGYFRSAQAAALEMVHPVARSRCFPRKNARDAFDEMFEAQSRLFVLALRERLN